MTMFIEIFQMLLCNFAVGGREFAGQVREDVERVLLIIRHISTLGWTHAGFHYNSKITSVQSCQHKTQDSRLTHNAIAIAPTIAPIHSTHP
jgi:hypothetical protein